MLPYIRDSSGSKQHCCPVRAPGCSSSHTWRSLSEPEKICCVACFSEGSPEHWRACLMGLQPKRRVTQCTGGRLTSTALLSFSLSLRNSCCN